MSNENQQDQKPKGQPNKFLQLSGAGLQMGVTIYLGYKLGQWLDAKYNKTFFESALTFTGVLIAIYALIKQVMNLNK